MIDKLLEAARSRRLSDFKQAVTRQIAVYPFIKDFGSHPGTVMICPDSMLTEDNPIGMLFMQLSKTLGISIYSVESQEFALKEVMDEKFLTGLLLGIDDMRLVKRIRTKTGYELGRTCATYIRIKGAFLQDPEVLGEMALKRDQFFFGNNPEEFDSKKNRVPFFIKEKFAAQFEDYRVGLSMAEAFVSMLQKVGISDMSDDLYSELIRNSLRYPSEFVTQFGVAMRVRDPRTRQRALVKRKIPKKPTRSPLLTKGEMDFIDKVITPHWAIDSSYSSNWESVVYSRGFSVSYAELRDSYNKRAELLQKFGKFTTERLQAMRTTSQSATMKKKDVSRDCLYSYLLSRPDPVEGFYRDLTLIVPKAELTEFALKDYLQSHGKVLQDFDGLAYIKSMIYRMYSADPLISKEGLRQLEYQFSDAQSTLRLTTVLSHFDDLRSRVATLVKNTKRYNFSSSEDDLRRLGQIQGLLRNLEKDEAFFSEFYEDPFVWLGILANRLDVRNPKDEVDNLLLKVNKIRSQGGSNPFFASG